MTSIHIDSIGLVHSCFTEKFGIPRQPGLVSSSMAQIELISPYNRKELVAGIEEFSHIWVHFLFHGAMEQGWRESVRPPGLGGKKRIGIFATRSPHRPNHMGISVVRLHGVRSKNGKLFLDVSGIDLLDGTPILDIKPYVTYSDSLPNAQSSYAGTFTCVKVELSENVELFCKKYEEKTQRDLKTLIVEVLSQDPRPASQRGKRDMFGVLLWDINVRFQVLGTEEECTFYVIGCE